MYLTHVCYRLSYYSFTPADELGCRYTVCNQGGPQETKTWRIGVPQRRHPHYCWHEHGTVVFQRSYRQRLFTLIIFHCLTPNFDRSFLEEGILQGQTQHHRRGGTHKLRQCAWKTCSTCGSQPQPHAVCLPFLWIRHFFYLTTRHYCLTSVGCKHTV